MTTDYLFSPTMTASLIAIALFLFVFCFVSIKGKKSTLKGQWLFDNFFENITDSFFQEDQLNKVARKLSVATDKYFFNCAITRQPSQLKKVIGMRLFAIVILILSILLGFLMQSILIGLIGVVVAIIIFVYLPMKANSAAKKRKEVLQRDLPRFMDLLKTALQINLPIDQAIEVTARHIDCTLSDELLSSLAEAKMGTQSWQVALQKLAQQYEIDDLSDFVLEIVVAFDKGISIYDVVSKKAASMKQMRLLRAKEKASRLTSIIVVPMFAFKIVPLLLIMMLPLVMAVDAF